MTEALLDYSEHAPSPRLRAVVQCIWQLSYVADGEPQLIVPDGCMEIVLNLGCQVRERDKDGSFQLQPMALFVGELRRPVSTVASGRMEFMGIRLRPGGARWMLDVPVSELVDTIVDTSPMARVFARELERTVASAEPADRVALVLLALEAQLDRRSAGPSAVRAAVKELANRDGRLEIDALAVAMGVSRRQLERRFVDEVGVGPKALATLFRFRRVLRAIQDGAADWAQVAVSCGYADQSHLIRDFKRFTGSTPSAYVRAEHVLSAAFQGPADAPFSDATG